MTVAAMRRIDRFAGIPLCWLTGMWLKVMWRSRMRSLPDQRKTVLVIKFFGLGSILLSTPFLTFLDRHNCRIIFLTFDINRELVERFTQPTLVLTISTRSPLPFARDTLSALKCIWSSDVDTVFDLEFFSKFSTLLSALSKAPMRIGFELPTLWRRMNLTHQVPIIHSVHVKDLFLEQLKPFGIVPSREPTAVSSLSSTRFERDSMEQKLGLRTNHADFVVLNINAGTTSLERRWAPDRFMKVVSVLKAKHPGIRFFFIGNTSEHDYVQDAIQGLSSEPRMCATNCAGLLSLGELIALFERCSLLLTNDTGPLHIAAAVGTRIVALFGPESPQFYGPVASARVVYKAISCSPCMNVYDAKLFICPYNARCMREISVDEVLAEVEPLLSQAQSRSALVE